MRPPWSRTCHVGSHFLGSSSSSSSSSLMHSHLQAEADAAEAEYHRVRFAAGVAGPSGEAVVTEEGAQFPLPEPEPIIAMWVSDVALN